jgi:hypothetical protein
MDFTVFGCKSRRGYGIVTLPGFAGCLKWRWLPVAPMKSHPSASISRMISRESLPTEHLGIHPRVAQEFHGRQVRRHARPRKFHRLCVTPFTTPARGRCHYRLNRSAGRHTCSAKSFSSSATPSWPYRRSSRRPRHRDSAPPQCALQWRQGWPDRFQPVGRISAAQSADR